MKKFCIVVSFIVALLFCSCATTNIESVDRSSNATSFKKGKLECTRISDCEWHITGIYFLKYLHVYGIDENLVKEIDFIANNYEHADLEPFQDHYACGLWPLPEEGILVIKSSKTISFDNLDISSMSLDEGISLKFSNLSVGFYSDNYLMEKLNISQQENKSLNISFQQISLLLNNNPEEFFSSYLGRKSELQWKALWNSDEGKHYLEFFQRMQTRIKNERVSTKIDLKIGHYNLSAGAFNTSYKDAKNNFIIKNADTSIFNSITMNEEDALKIEDINNRSYYGREIISYMNYVIVGIENDKPLISDIAIDFVDAHENSFICSVPLSNDAVSLNQNKISKMIETGNFSYNDIPFGATYEEIKTIFSNEKVKMKESNRIEFQFNKVFNLGIMTELCEPYHQWSTGGVAGKPYSYESQQIGSYNYDYVKVLEVYSDNNYWRNLSGVTFYFLDTGNNVFKLFLYEKSYYLEEFTNTEFAVVMAKQSEQISTALNSNYINKEMKQYQKYSDTINCVALCYSWKDKKNKIFLIGDTWKSDREASVYRTLYYYDTSFEQIGKTQKKKYVEQKETEAQKKSQEKINSSEIDF